MVGGRLGFRLFVLPRQYLNIIPRFLHLECQSMRFRIGWWSVGVSKRPESRPLYAKYVICNWTWDEQVWEPGLFSTAICGQHLASNRFQTIWKQTKSILTLELWTHHITCRSYQRNITHHFFIISMIFNGLVWGALQPCLPSGSVQAMSLRAHQGIVHRKHSIVLSKWKKYLN